MSATLQWEPPSDNGGRPVLGYVIEMKDKFAPDWIEVISNFFIDNYVIVIFISFKRIVSYNEYLLVQILTTKMKSLLEHFVLFI